MEFFKKRDERFFRGLGAEYAFNGADGISLVSGGRVLKVRLEGAEGERTTSRIVLAEPDGKLHVIYEGDALEAASRYVSISASATSARTTVSVSRKGLYAALAAFTAIYVVFCHPASRTADPAVGEVSELSSLLKSIPAVSQGGVPGLNMPPVASLQVPPALSSLGSGSAVLDKPAFLDLPEENASAAGADVDKTAEVAAIPAYSADLYTSPATPAADKQEAVATPAEVAEPEGDKVSDAASTAADTEAAAPAAKDDAPVQAAASNPPAADQPSKAEDAPASAAAESGEEDPKALAASVAKRMSADDAHKLLGQLQTMTEMDPSMITPEILAKLPHEMAQALRDTGVLDDPAAMPEKGDAPYAAIRLPAGVIDKYRGKDGIASIPENDTYAALGNRIPLQLPGGGDIRKPEDLMLFGFKP